MDIHDEIRPSRIKRHQLAIDAHDVWLDAFFVTADQWMTPENLLEALSNEGRFYF